MATPVHLFATDSAVTAEAREVGFTAGLSPAEGEHLQHEELLSLLVHLLARTGHAPGSTVPPVLPDGFPRTAILPRTAAGAGAGGPAPVEAAELNDGRAASADRRGTTAAGGAP